MDDGRVIHRAEPAPHAGDPPDFQALFAAARAASGGQRAPGSATTT